MFAGNFAPSGWAFCNGQLLSIADNTTLFQLIGTTYGGDGQTTFALPDLRSRVPIHQGTGLSSYVIGQAGGQENVTLTVQQVPGHSHPPQCDSSASNSPNPTGRFWGVGTSSAYASGGATAAMNPSTVGAAGGSQPHDNVVPYLAINFIISLFGIFPSQT
jgi:microcystin-dependent protein